MIVILPHTDVATGPGSTHVVPCLGNAFLLAILRGSTVRDSVRIPAGVLHSQTGLFEHVNGPIGVDYLESLVSSSQTSWRRPHLLKGAPAVHALRRKIPAV